MAGKLTDGDRLPIMMVRTINGLSPAAAYDAERLDQYGLGGTVEVKVMQRRSNQHHRMYWKILSLVAEQTDEWPTAGHLHDALKLHLGYTQPLKLVDGRTIWRADSTAFGSMDQAEFKVYFDRAMAAIADHILPGVDPVALVKAGEPEVALQQNAGRAA